MADFPRKYWWMVLVLVPIVVALIDKVPDLLQAVQAHEGREVEQGTAGTIAQSDSNSSKQREVVTKEQTSTGTGEGTAREARLPETALHPGASHPKPLKGESGELRSPISDLQVVRAIGIGYPPDHIQDSGRRVAMARRAAETLAMRNLAEAIEGVFIEAHSKTKEGVLASDVVKVRVTAVLHLARKVDETQNPDGSIEVVMEAPIQE